MKRMRGAGQLKSDLGGIETLFPACLYSCLTALKSDLGGIETILQEQVKSLLDKVKIRPWRD